MFLMKTAVIILICFPLFGNAQNLSKQYIDKGLLRAQGNIALGIPANTVAGTNMYLTGDLEYYVENNVSIKGTIHYYLGSFGGESEFKMNHSGFLGSNFHFRTNTHFDPYVGIFPGYAIGQLNTKVIAQSGLEPQSSNPVVFTPLISFSGGFNYYANRFFNLFINAQYVVGTHLSDVDPVSLNELKVSFGLGYHIWATKKHFGFKKPGQKNRY